MTDFSTEPVSAVALSPSGTHLAAASGHNNVCLVKIPPLKSAPTQLSRATNLHPAPSLTSLSFPSASTLYLCDARGSFKRFDVSDGLSPSYTVSAAHGGEELTGIAALSSSSSVATSGKDGIVRVWDAETKQTIARLAGHRYEVRDVAVGSSSDSDIPVTLVVSAGRDRTVRLWDVRAAASKEVHVFKGHAGWVHSVALAGGGSPVVVSCGGDKTVRVWDLMKMEERVVLKGHDYRVWGVAVDEKGELAVSGSTDATVRAWDLGGVEEPCVFEGHGDTVLAVDMTRDGRLAVSGCEDGGVYLWECASLFGRKVNNEEGILVDVRDEAEKLGVGVPKSLDTKPLVVEKAPVQQVVVSEVKAVKLAPKEEVAVDAERLKAAVAVSVDQLPKYDKSAAELVNALQRIQELEKSVASANARTMVCEQQVTKLQADVVRKDTEIAVLRKQLEASQNLVNAANVRALLAANPRKVDVALDYEEPVNKIGAVSDQLSALAARLDAMIATN